MLYSLFFRRPFITGRCYVAGCALGFALLPGSPVSAAGDPEAGLSGKPAQTSHQSLTDPRTIIGDRRVAAFDRPYTFPQVRAEVSLPQKNAYSRQNTTTLACDPAEGGFTQNAPNNGSFQWAGPTQPSTVSVTMTTSTNHLGEQVVVPNALAIAPARSFANADNSKTFTEITQFRWLKNGGHTGDGTNVNNYVGRVNLSFSTPVPANEIVIFVMDMDTRGVLNTAPDGSITFTAASQATPADFEQLTWTNAPAAASSSTYNNSDGSIAFGIGTTPPATGYNKYVAITGKNTNTVSEIRIFIRNVADDVGIFVGWLNPCPTVLPVTLKSFTVAPQGEGNLLKWSTASEENFDQFLIERNADPRAEFGTIGTVRGGKREYSYFDASPEKGVSYYRLKMLDRDGSFDYSRVQSIDRQLEKDVYPNPTNDRVVYIDRETGIRSGTLVSMSGKRYALTMQEFQNRYRFQLDAGLVSGLYVLECVTTEGKILRKKVTIN